MITNERQHRISKAEIGRFEKAIAHAEGEEPAEDVHPRLQEAMIDGLRSQLDELRSEVSEYEALRAGKIKRRVLNSLLDLPAALIEGRIARQLTQRDLGRRLGVPEQQIQRYEKTRYAGASLERLQEVADAVGLTLKETVEYDVAALTERGRRSGRGGESMAGRRTGKAAASAAGKTLASKRSSKTAKRAAASDLAQVRNEKVTSKKAASAAGKTVASKSASKTARRAAASDLSQAAPRKKKQ
jgi:transcriptional regulator with XRE-family HTH domain